MKHTDGRQPTLIAGGVLRAAQAAWVAVALLTLAVLLAGTPQFFEELRSVCETAPCRASQFAPADLLRLQSAGLTPDLYAAVMTTVRVVSAAAWCLVGVVIFWRKHADPAALLAAFFLVAVGSGAGPNTIPMLLGEINPVWWLPARILDIISIAALSLFLYAFPDGRFVPRWTGLIAIGFIGVWTPYWIAPGSLLDSNTWPPIVLYLVLLLWFGGGLGAQLYRYRRVSTPRQRQQTKWVIVGLVAGLTGFLGLLAPEVFAPPWFDPGPLIPVIVDAAIYGCLLLIPLSVAIAILRARLYEIDRLINRALVYGALSGALLIVYVGSVALLQSLFRSLAGQESNLAIVAATLVSAALFQPLRGRLQTTIDRRFYRRTYDAASALVAFSAQLREEVDLARLTNELVRVVDETMQPTQVALWLPPVPGAPGRAPRE